MSMGRQAGVDTVGKHRRARGQMTWALGFIGVRNMGAGGVGRGMGVGAAGRGARR